MDDYLGRYFLEPRQKKICVGHEKALLGNTLTILPSAGQVKLVADAYTEEVLNLPYTKYFFSVFGKPEILQIVKHQNFANMGEKWFLSGKFDSETCEMSAGTYLEAAPQIFWELNHKYKFQELVCEVLGEEAGTGARLIKAGKKVDEVVDLVAKSLSNDGRWVVKACEGEQVVVGGGKMMTVVNRENAAARVRELLKKIGGELESPFVTCDLLVEPYIEHLYSPSATLFITENNIQFLETNLQFLNENRFQGSTNVWPEFESTQIVRHKLREMALVLAKRCQDMGARGFIGFDAVVTLGNRIIFVEANYRSSGASEPQLLTQRADKFENRHDFANWILVQRFGYKENMEDLPKVLDILEKENFLLTRAGENINELRVMPTNALGGEKFHLLFFWPKENGHVDKLSTIQKVMRLMGDEREVNLNTRGFWEISGYR